MNPLQAVVLGNATLDVLCYTVDDVPRYDSIAFDHTAIAPGGCGSNTAIGLRALGVSTALVACIGDDEPGNLALHYWKKAGLDVGFIRRIEGKTTGVSVGLVDSQSQPRFIHTTGANAGLDADALDVEILANRGVQALLVAGFFVLPGLCDGRLPERLSQAQQKGMLVTLDVVHSPRMDFPEPLWPCLPYLDVFLCNATESRRITGLERPEEAAGLFRQKGAKAVVIKLGAEGCWLESDGFNDVIAALPVNVVDTTGAGDAFHAGLVAALLRGGQLPQACRAANEAGAKIVSSEGAIQGWSRDFRL